MEWSTKLFFSSPEGIYRLSLPFRLPPHDSYLAFNRFPSTKASAPENPVPPSTWYIFTTLWLQVGFRSSNLFSNWWPQLRSQMTTNACRLLVETVAIGSWSESSLENILICNQQSFNLHEKYFNLYGESTISNRAVGDWQLNNRVWTVGNRQSACQWVFNKLNINLRSLT